MTLVLLLMLSSQDPDSLRYLSVLNQADRLYQARRYESALRLYQQAHILQPDADGPLTGIGWSYLQLGYFFPAETSFRRVVNRNPAHEPARQGLRLLPRRYRGKATVSGGSSLSARPFVNWSGFLEYNDRYQTTVTAGFQTTRLDTWQRVNGGLVVYRKLGFPWSARLDLYVLRQINSPGSWQFVVAPSLARLINAHALRLVPVFWNRFEVFGLQLEAVASLPRNLTLSASPSINQAGGRLGWLLPAELQLDLGRRRPQNATRVSLSAGLAVGSIANHVDLAIPTLYNPPQRLEFQAKAGAEIMISGRFRVMPFLAWERYDNREQRFYPSLTLSIQH